MSIVFPEFQVGDPVYHEGLAVFPLFGTPSDSVQYDLSDTAIEKGVIAVQEVSEAGSVPDLSVENKGDIGVLFLEGEELVGAKQNRVLNTSILIAAHCRSRIPVSCVEAGRWRYKSRWFGSSGRHSSSSLRRVLKGSVNRSLREKRGHRSDQGEVWQEVDRQRKALGASSATNAMSDTYDANQERLTEFRTRMHSVKNAVGIAVAVGGKITTIDLFDKPATCEKVWDRLLSGAIMDAIESREESKHVESSDVAQAIAGLNGLPWQTAESVGEGNEYRAESPNGDYASALVVAGVLIHGSVVCAG